MNHRAEMWSLPWHELQRSLAAGLNPGAGGRFAGPAAPALPFPGTLRCPSNPTWLGRARARAALCPSAAK
jgi:hypothetical protein